MSPAAGVRTLDSREEPPKVDRKVTSQGPIEWDDNEMSWFKRKSQSVTVTVTVYVGDALLDVTGESHYQNNLMAIAGVKTDGGYNLAIDAVLVREPDNEYDENAIAVYARVKDAAVDALKVGYVARELAVDLAPALEEKNASGEVVALEGFIRGGWDRGDGDTGHYGISITYDPTEFERPAEEV